MGENSSFFTAEFFGANRQRLRSLFKGTAPIVITANGLLQKSGDTTHPFAQDSSFWYLTGIDEPDVLLVIDRDKEYLILPEREKKRATFDGNLNKDNLANVSGITDILGEKDGKKHLEWRIKKVRHVATLSASPAYVKNYGFYSNPARSNLINDIKSINSDVELLDLNQHLVQMRVVKQEPELKALQIAVDTTVKSLKQIAKRISKFNNEYEIEAEITRDFVKTGFNHAYQPIVAAGLNACTLHYVANNRHLAKNQLVLVDAGASVSHYAADISRTFAVNKPTRRQRSVFESVTRVQDFALECLMPGVILKDYELQVRQFMGEQLRQLGLIKTINNQNVARFFPHSTSHFLGLDVHDVGNWEKPLLPGMVLTVEPGIYIPKENIGVRIEDDVLITPVGVKVLSSKLPREL